MNSLLRRLRREVPWRSTAARSVHDTSEESAATQIGFWTSYGAETGTFSGGSIVASNIVASTAIFRFTGTAVSWIGVKCNVCGIAVVSIDGGLPTTVNRPPQRAGQPRLRTGVLRLGPRGRESHDRSW